MKTILLIIVFVSTSCSGQVKSILFTRWERTDYDSLGKHIPENKLIFDVNSFEIYNTNDTIEYFPYGSGMNPQSYATYRVNFKDSIIQINYYKHDDYDSIAKSWNKKYFSDSYSFSLSISPPTIADKQHIMSNAKSSEIMQEVKYNLTLRSLTNNQTSLYNSYNFVHNRAFRRNKRRLNQDIKKERKNAEAKDNEKSRNRD